MSSQECRAKAFCSAARGRPPVLSPQRQGLNYLRGNLQCLHGEQQTALSKSCAKTKWHQTLRQPKLAGLFLQR